MRLVLARLWHILRDYDHEYTEFQLALFKTLMGFWFILPFHTFTETPAYRMLGGIAPETAWGIFFMAIGVPQMFFILDGEHYQFRSWLSMTGLMIWTILSVLNFYGNYTSPGWIISAIFALSNVVIYLRLRSALRYALSGNFNHAVQ